MFIKYILYIYNILIKKVSLNKCFQLLFRVEKYIFRMLHLLTFLYNKCTSTNSCKARKHIKTYLIDIHWNTGKGCIGWHLFNMLLLLLATETWIQLAHIDKIGSV